ncbi:MAG: hypothetical protein U0694_08325 [Anaerolineae bacterium]
MQNQTANDYFRMILVTVVGQAFAAAGYTLEERPMQWAGGMFRFVKTLQAEVYAFIEFQALTYVDSEWSSGQPSRFRITLIRSDSPAAAPGKAPAAARRTLSALVVEDFGVTILPSADHWWTFKDTESLGRALAEAGHLIVGYGIPWLAGELLPPQSS